MLTDFSIATNQLILINSIIYSLQFRMRTVKTKILDCALDVSEFELQSLYYDHIQVNILGNDINPIIPSAMIKIVTILFFFLWDGFE